MPLTVVYFGCGQNMKAEIQVHTSQSPLTNTQAQNYRRKKREA